MTAATHTSTRSTGQGQGHETRTGIKRMTTASAATKLGRVIEPATGGGDQPHVRQQSRTIFISRRVRIKVNVVGGEVRVIIDCDHRVHAQRESQSFASTLTLTRGLPRLGRRSGFMRAVTHARTHMGCRCPCSAHADWIIHGYDRLSSSKCNLARPTWNFITFIARGRLPQSA